MAAGLPRGNLQGMIDDAVRQSILTRRGRFVGVALAMGAIGGGAACGEPSVCLEYAPGCVASEKTYTLGQSSAACVGKIVLLRAIAGTCDTSEDVTPKTVFATSDPAKLVLEGSVARGLAAGTVTVTALIDGQPVGTIEIVISDCVVDAT